MEIEKILRKSLDYLRGLQTLPNEGLLAGGSLANTAWALSRGLQPVVNDIDIFCVSPNLIKEKFDFQHTKIGPYSKSMKIVKDDYLRFFYLVDNFLIIQNTSNDGLLNLINYSSTTYDPNIVIESFDLNCCQVGYVIESDEFIWTPSFEKFLVDGKIQVSNLSTPCHTAIRYAKKCSELGVQVDEFELDLIEFCISHKLFNDITKFRFKSKYRDLFLKYENILGSRFNLVNCKGIENWLKEILGIEDQIYTLKLKNEEESIDQSSSVFGLGVTKLFLDWVRENGIGREDFGKCLWEVNFLKDESMNLKDYISDYDDGVSTLKFMNKLGRYSSGASAYLHGLTLPKQISVVESILTPLVNNSIFALAIIQGNTFGGNVPKIENILKEDISFEEKLMKIKKVSREISDLAKSESFMELWKKKYMWEGTRSIEWIDQNLFDEVFLRKFKIKKLLRTRDSSNLKSINP